MRRPFRTRSPPGGAHALPVGKGYGYVFTQVNKRYPLNEDFLMARYRPPPPPAPVDDPTTPNVDESTIPAPSNDYFSPQPDKRFICRVCNYAHSPERWAEKWEETPDEVEYVTCDQCGRTPVTAEGDPKYIWHPEEAKPVELPPPAWVPDVMICSVCSYANLPGYWAAELAAGHAKPGCAKCGSTDCKPATPPPAPPVETPA